jgi:hypothetical protein
MFCINDRPTYAMTGRYTQYFNRSERRCTFALESFVACNVFIIHYFITDYATNNYIIITLS